LISKVLWPSHVNAIIPILSQADCDR